MIVPAFMSLFDTNYNTCFNDEYNRKKSYVNITDLDDNNEDMTTFKYYHCYVLMDYSSGLKILMIK